MEHWKQFLDKDVIVIHDDSGFNFPRKKNGFLVEINNTHLILKRRDKTEALRLVDVRRIELR